MLIIGTAFLMLSSLIVVLSQRHRTKKMLEWHKDVVRRCDEIKLWTEIRRKQ